MKFGKIHENFIMKSYFQGKSMSHENIRPWKFRAILVYYVTKLTKYSTRKHFEVTKLVQIVFVIGSVQ